MKRFGAVASLLLVAAIGVGAFVYAGSDSGKGHKSSATVLKNDSVKGDSNTTVTTAKHQDPPKPVTSNSVASESPPPKPTTDDNVFHVGDDEKPELDGYEARRVFVGVSPSVTVTGKTIQIDVRGFHANEPVTIYIDPAPVPGNAKSSVVVPPSPGSVVVSITTDKRGRGKVKFVVTQAPGRWVVSAIGTVKDGQGAVRSSATILKVVLKK
jgi:hypothetical protein